MGFGELCFFPCGGQCKDGGILGSDLGQVGHLGVWKLLLGAELGDLEGKLGHREVMLKLSWAMLCYVEAIGQIFFGHVVGFASRNAFPLAGPRY